ncbi:MaoC/PaaZ C-terminal domain-containing protein [Bosea vestrisii]|uniref:MaoC/PaaZ C-terminal domain-containing protein n=1 Tax=Bosea vestrisii TaxID=151416 RepID=A0ABW0HKR3_9HYPH
MTPLQLDDRKPGQTFISGSHALDEEQIKAFAGAFDPQPFHLDGAAAEKTLFGGLAASVWHTAAVTMRLNVESGLPLANGIIGAGGEIAWPAPTRPVDILHVESEVTALVPPGRAPIAASPRSSAKR